MEKIIVPKVKELRESVGMSQSQLARALGKTEATIRNWESGRTSMEWVKTILDLCQVLGCRPEDLIEEREV